MRLPKHPLGNRSEYARKKGAKRPTSAFHFLSKEKDHPKFIPKQWQNKTKYSNVYAKRVPTWSQHRCASDKDGEAICKSIVSVLNF